MRLLAKSSVNIPCQLKFIFINQRSLEVFQGEQSKFFSQKIDASTSRNTASVDVGN